MARINQIVPLNKADRVPAIFDRIVIPAALADVVATTNKNLFIKISHSCQQKKFFLIVLKLFYNLE
jgi:hypothetical protein